MINIEFELLRCAGQITFARTQLLAFSLFLLYELECSFTTNTLLSPMEYYFKEDQKSCFAFLLDVNLWFPAWIKLELWLLSLFFFITCPWPLAPTAYCLLLTVVRGSAKSAKPYAKGASGEGGWEGGWERGEREGERDEERERGERIMLNVGGIPDQVQVQPPQSFLSSIFFLRFFWT